MNEWLLIFGMTLLTFTPRYLPLGFSGKVKINPIIGKSLKFVPVAVLTSIITQSSLFREGELVLDISNYYLIATVVSFVTAKFINHLFIIVTVGMVTFFMLKYIL